MPAFHEQHFDKPDSFTVNHFKVEGIPRSTLYSILQRKADGISAERQSGTGKQNAKIMTKAGIKELARLFDHKCGISQRKAARIMKCSQQVINWTLKNKISIKKRKKIKVSKRTDTQNDKIRRLCRQLYG